VKSDGGAVIVKFKATATKRKAEKENGAALQPSTATA
jgi:hypothetical protein